MIPAGVVALGLVQGSLAAIDALGLVLLYRTTRVVNLAQPAMGYVGGVVTGLLVVSGHWSFWWAAPVGIAVGAMLGVLTDRVILRRLADAPRAVVLVATVGLAQIFVGIAAALPFAFVGSSLPTYPISLGFTLSVGGTRLSGPQLLVLIILPLAWLGTYLFLHRSRFGLAALALGQEQERARALGVPSAAVRGAVWAVAGMLASLGGLLAIPAQGYNIGGGFGPIVLLFALAPAVLAGFRSVHVAVLAALGLGVAYYAVGWYTDTSSGQQLVIGLAVIVAIAVSRRRLGREDAAARASSWEAAATPRPLSRALSSLRSIRVASRIGLVLAISAAAIPPLILSPSDDISYGTAAAYAIAAIGVAVAWMFAGEVSLGHWGFAGFGGAVAALTPGPWPFRCLVATGALAAAGVVLALASRRRSTLSFAVISLAAAATAPVAALRVVGRTSGASPGAVAVVAGGLAVLVAAAVTALRRSSLGARMVAARDDPQRAPWLGANVARTRLVALTISVGLAGLAGALYFCSSTIGLTKDGVDAIRSLELLSMTVIGGLGSPAGALLGAGAFRAAQRLLPGSWQLFLTGAGILAVVIYAPAGMSRVLGHLRDRAVRLLTPVTREPEPRGEEAA